MADFTVKAANEIRDDFLRTYKAGLVRLGVANPNVSPGSDLYVLGQSIGDQLEVAMANAQTQADLSMPDTATGEALDAIVEGVGMPGRRSAVGAAGNITLSSTSVANVPAGTELTDNAGLRYAVVVSGQYANGATVPVQALDFGDATNHAAGDILRWVSPPPFASMTAAVSTGGLSGGVEAEDDESLRQRLYEWFRNPPAAGNAAHVALLAEQADPLVQKAFVYPAAAGPATVAVAVVGYPTQTSKSRAVPDVTVRNIVKPYVDGMYPEGASAIVTSVEDVEVDVSFAVALPSAVTAKPPGPGGGWTDAVPWPRNANAEGDFRATVATVTSATSFVVNAPTAPTANITQVAWLSPYTWQVYTATVTSWSLVAAGQYAIVLSAPFVGITAGCYVSPNAENIETYFTTIVSAFAAMGPGEKVLSNSPLFGRAFRHPPPAKSWPYRIDASMLRALVLSSDEVLDASFLYRSQTQAPAVPSTIPDKPRIFIPRHIALYEAV